MVSVRALVRLVAAAPADIVDNGRLPERPLVVASEYEGITRSWIAKAGLNATFVRSYGDRKSTRLNSSH